MRISFISLLGLSMALASTCQTGEAATVPQWPQFRGPGARGVDDSFALPTTWSVPGGEKVLWATPIPGLAHASPIIWGDRIYVTTAVRPGKAELKIGMYGSGDSADDKISHQWRLLALDKASGQIVWNVLAHEGVPKLQRHTKASQCNSTPATDGTNIVAIFGSEGLFCFDLTGQLRWRKDLGRMDAGKLYSPPPLQWGFGSSPVLHEGLVVVQCDVVSEQFLAAFRVQDGHEIWRVARREVGTWSTPALDTEEGRRQVIVNGYRQIAGYDLDSGRERWHLSGGGDNPIPTPILADGLVFLTSAHGNYRPMRAVRLTASGDITPGDISQTNAAIAWVHPRQGSYIPTPIVVGELLYSGNDSGIVTCFDARTGLIHYSERIGNGSQTFSASPVSDGRHIYFPCETGEVYVLRAGPQFSVAATNLLGEICMATPAISSGSLYFRTQNRLIAIAQKGAP